MKKPRKRITQTLAEKGVETKLHPWIEVMGSYSFTPHPSVGVLLAEQDGIWTMHALINKQTYRGTRPSLEEAYKATANLLFKHAKEYWLRMDTRAVTAPWAHVLPEAL